MAEERAPDPEPQETLVSAPYGVVYESIAKSDDDAGSLRSLSEHFASREGEVFAIRTRDARPYLSNSMPLRAQAVV